MSCLWALQLSAHVTHYRQVNLDCFDAPEYPPPNRQSDMEAEIMVLFSKDSGFCRAL